MILMKLIRFRHQWDYGHDWYAQILFTRSWALFQGSISWGHYPGWPYLQIKIGSGSLVSVMFSAYKFGFSIGLCDRTWRWYYLDFDNTWVDSRTGT